jgi:hypothetical protein
VNSWPSRARDRTSSRKSAGPRSCSAMMPAALTRCLCRRRRARGRDVSCSVDEIVTCARLVGRQGSTHAFVDNTVGRHWRGCDGSGSHRPLSPSVIPAGSWSGQRPVGLATSRWSTERPHSLSGKCAQVAALLIGQPDMIDIMHKNKQTCCAHVYRDGKAKIVSHFADVPPNLTRSQRKTFLKYGSLPGSMKMKHRGCNAVSSPPLPMAFRETLADYLKVQPEAKEPNRKRKKRTKKRPPAKREYR